MAFALVESGKITKLMNGNKGIKIGDNQYPSSFFTTIYSEAERNAAGVYTIEFDNTNKKSEEYYDQFFEDIEINSCDIGMYEITERNGELVKARFGDRFNLHIFDSTKLKPEFIANKYDIMFIDGAHDYGPVTSDMKLWIESDIPYAVVDDLQNQNVKRAFNELLNNDNFTIMHSATYTAVLPHRMRNDKNIQPKQVPIKLVKKVT